MLILILLVIVFGCVDCLYYHNAQEDTLPCNLTLKENVFHFKRSYYSISHKGSLIYFSPCLALERVRCSKTAMLCVKTKSETTNFHNLKTINGTFFTLHSKDCKANVSLSEQLEPKVTELNDECGYLLKIPNPNLKPACTKEIDNQTLEFNQIPQDIEVVQNDGRIVVINLCRPSRNCKDDVSSVCVATSNGSTSLGYTEKRAINYNVDKGVEFKFKTNNDGPFSVVSLRCNWTTALGDIRYNAASQRSHKITIETSFGCVKLRPNCVVSLENYMYNLSSLNRYEGWKVTNDFGKNIVINICGPLLTLGLCSEQHSQICHYSEGSVENYGTTMTTITLDDTLKTSFRDGSACPKKPNQPLSTNVNLICSFEEKGPVLKRINECSYELDWETPKACPKLIEFNATPATFKPCTVTEDHVTYDLSDLTSNISNHVVRAPRNVDFIINVCRSIVVDDETLCQPTMGICSRDNGAPNIKRRFVSIGNTQGPRIENGRLVLRYKYGSYCRKHFTDASAVIFFNCSESEVGPIFIKEENCEHVFTWETKHACARQRECTLGNASGKTVSLINAERKIFKFSEKQTEYTLDICTPTMMSETNGVITRFTANRTIRNDGTEFYIQYELNEACENNRFNVIRIHPKCDIITLNEHYDYKNISDCVLNVNFKHHSICELYKSTELENRETIEIVKNTKQPVERDCTYQYHGTDININTLQPLTVISSTDHVYTIGINRTSSCRDFVCGDGVKLVTLLNCPKAKSDNDELTLLFESRDGNEGYVVDVVFRCKNLGDAPKVLHEGPNVASFEYPLDEVCFETKNHDLFYVIGIVLSVIVIVVCLLIYKRDLMKRICRGENKRLTYVYCKNGDD